MTGRYICCDRIVNRVLAWKGEKERKVLEREKKKHRMERKRSAIDRKWTERRKEVQQRERKRPGRKEEQS